MRLSSIWPGPRVVMRGSYGEGNFGDDTLMLATHALLRRAFEMDEIAVALGASSTADAATHATKHLPGAAFVPYRGGAGARLEVWGGGTQWCSFPRTAARSPLPARLARRFRQPVGSAAYALRRLDAKARPPISSAAVGVGIGPFADEARELASAQQLRRTQFLAVRDAVSKGHCDSWGLDRVVFGADLCFVDHWWTRQGAVSRSAGTPTRSIGVIVRDWPHDTDGDTYATPLLRATAALRAEGLRVDFISFSPKADAGWRRELGRAGERIVEWGPDAGSVDEFLQQQANYDCLVSSRYHGAIFGALVGTPVICVDIEPKLRIAADTVQGRLWRKPFDDSELLALVRTVTENHAAETARIAAAVALQRSQAAEMASRFLDFVQSSVFDSQQESADTWKAPYPA